MSKPERASYETVVLVLLSLSRGAESRKKILIALLSGPNSQQAKDASDKLSDAEDALTVAHERVVLAGNAGEKIWFYQTPF